MTNLALKSETLTAAFYNKYIQRLNFYMLESLVVCKLCRIQLIISLCNMNTLISPNKNK